MSRDRSDGGLRAAIAASKRIQTTARGRVPSEVLLTRLVRVSLEGLEQMFLPETRSFAFTVRRDARGAAVPEGQSVRYGAIVVLGARWLDDPLQRRVFGGETAGEFATRLAGVVQPGDRLGDLALVAWACAEAGSPDAARVLEWARARAGGSSAVHTVELAWLLSALVAARRALDTKESARQVRTRLLGAFREAAGVFPHEIDPAASSLRDHVACFADQVYPIQALARYHAAYADDAALAAANRCAAQICRLQGAGGQWWWHYDARSGAVIEGYPVYSVHQDAMGPMALFDLREAGGADHAEAIARSLEWMQEAPEIASSLIDDAAGVVWRKVGRAEPGKLVRSARALASRLHPGLRLGWLDALFPAERVDWESRPYHLGWVLHTWLGSLQ
jgi:hypothetical protein